MSVPLLNKSFANHNQNLSQTKFPQTERQLDGSADGEGEPDVLRQLADIRKNFG